LPRHPSKVRVYPRDHRDEFSVAAQCRVLRVHRSGFYAWLADPQSLRDRENERLVGLIKDSYEKSSASYGSPRVFKDLREGGETCGENRVAKLMKSQAIRAHSRFRRPRYRYTKPSLVTPNKVNQEFDVPGPDRIWVTDITYIETAEGFLYLAVVIDLFSRKVVGWATDSLMKTELVLTALLNALWRRRPKDSVMVHSDQGSQFNSDAWARFCRDHRVERSMSRRGNCYDNAVVESFFSSLKKERVRGRTYLSRDEARSDVFDYIEVFYDRKRRHSKLGMMSPSEFEQFKIGV
jgi:putative transposase